MLITPSMLNSNGSKCKVHPASNVHSNTFVPFRRCILDPFAFFVMLLQPLAPLPAFAISTKLTSEQSVVGSLVGDFVGAGLMVGLCRG